MAEEIKMTTISPDQVLSQVKMDKAIALHFDATPPNISPDKIRPYRASGMANFCPVESAFVIEAIRNKEWDTVVKWNKRKVLPGKVIQIVDTGTVVHKQLQYYAGLLGKVKEGQWRCPACGFLTHREVTMPTISIEDNDTGLDLTYPAPCPRCKGKNLAEFPSWLYEELTLIEKAKGVPEILLVKGHCDGKWKVRVRVGEEMVWVTVIVDFKTINKNGFDEKYGGGLPKTDHIPQMQTYLNLADVEIGVLIYYCKDTSAHKYYLVYRDKTYWAEIIAKVNWARSGDMSDKAKYRVCSNVGHPRARGCFFIEHCWGKKAPENFLA